MTLSQEEEKAEKAPNAVSLLYKKHQFDSDKIRGSDLNSNVFFFWVWFCGGDPLVCACRSTGVVNRLERPKHHRK